MIQFRQPDFEQMARIEQELAAVVVKHRGHVETALVVFALVRVARPLLQQYSGVTKRDLQRVLTAFLEERAQPEESPLVGVH